MRPSFAFLTLTLFAFTQVPGTAEGEDFVLKNPPFGKAIQELKDAHTVYDPYLQAESTSDFKAMSALLTPDFTCTREGKQDAHRQSLKDMALIVNALRGLAKQGTYKITFDTFFIHDDRATAKVEEKFSDLPIKSIDAHTDKSDKSKLAFTSWGVTYIWTHHWVKTPQGWRLKSMERTAD